MTDDAKVKEFHNELFHIIQNMTNEAKLDDGEVAVCLINSAAIFYVKDALVNDNRSKSHFMELCASIYDDWKGWVRLTRT
jgi:hypothetical protein